VTKKKVTVDEFCFHTDEGKCNCFFCQHPDFIDHLTTIVKELNKVKKGDLRDSIWSVILGTLADQANMDTRTKIYAFDIIHHNLASRAIAVAGIMSAYREKKKKERRVNSVMIS